MTCKLTSVLLTLSVSLLVYTFVEFEKKARFSRIISGYTPSNDEIKSVVLITTEYTNAKGEHSLGRCTGTILNEYHILTAAHCFTQMELKSEYKLKEDLDITIYIGMKDQQDYINLHKGRKPSRIQKIEVKKVGFNVFTGASWHTRELDSVIKDKVKFSDIAIVRTSTRINYSKTRSESISLLIPKENMIYDDYPYENLKSIVVGWGSTQEKTPHTRQPKENNLKSMAVDTKSLKWCRDKSRSMHFHSGQVADIPDVFCGEGVLDDIDWNNENLRPQLCFGDSGGPILKRHDNKPMQFGISVWVDELCSLDFNGFLRVDLHLPWIQKIVEEIPARDVVQLTLFDEDSIIQEYVNFG